MLAALHIATVVGYGLHLLWQLRWWHKPYRLTWLLVACIALHATTLLIPLTQNQFGFFSSLSLASWVCVVVALCNKKLAFTLVWLVLLAAVTSMLPARLYNNYTFTSDNDIGLIIHALTSIPAFAVTLLCTVLLAYHRVRSYQLKHLAKQQWSFVPALETVERIVARMMWLALLLLGLGLLTGVGFMQDFFAQHLAHKTFFSALAWVLLLGINIKRLSGGIGWDRMFWYMLAVTLLLFTGYFVSRFVLEFLL